MLTAIRNFLNDRVMPYYATPELPWLKPPPPAAPGQDAASVK